MAGRLEQYENDASVMRSRAEGKVLPLVDDRKAEESKNEINSSYSVIGILFDCAYSPDKKKNRLCGIRYSVTKCDYVILPISIKRKENRMVALEIDYERSGIYKVIFKLDKITNSKFSGEYKGGNPFLYPWKKSKRRK